MIHRLATAGVNFSTYASIALTRLSQMMALTYDQIDSIADTLIDSEQLRLPARLSEGPVPTSEKRHYMHVLLQHDPGVFLERHGKHITKGQRGFFEPLRDDSYEVDFYLKLFEDEDQKHQMKVRQNHKQ